MLPDLRDVTFTIPFRQDSEERIRNLRTIIAYLNKHLETNIIVCEESAERKFTDSGKFQYIHIPSNSPYMHRTRCLNIMAKMSKTPIIVNYDTDVLIPIRQYQESTHLIRNNVFDMVYPYGGKFINYIPPQLDTIIQNVSLDGITEESGHIIHPNSVGGAIFWNKARFFSIGMENENYISWGWEDNDRIVRAMRLGCRINRVSGSLFHLNHPPSVNSANTSSDAYRNNEREFMKINGMDREMIQRYISTWSWLK